MYLHHLHNMAPSATLPNPSTAYDGGLTTEQLAFWDSNGYLIIEDALDQQTVATLMKETHRMLEEDLDLKNHPMTRFSTGEGDNDHVGDDYFLTSGDKVRFFFEEGMSFSVVTVVDHFPRLRHNTGFTITNNDVPTPQTHSTPPPPP